MTDESVDDHANESVDDHANESVDDHANESVDDHATLSCAHDPAVGYALGFVVRDDADGIDSACSMRATVHEREPTADDVDAVGCAIPDCENHHERVATDLREHAARHSGNVTGDACER